MTDAHRGYARAVQSAIYRAGISGTRPRVPVDAARLEEGGGKGAEAPKRSPTSRAAQAPSWMMAANRAAFDRWQVWPRPLRDVSSARPVDRLPRASRCLTPLLLAPLGVMEMAHDEADLAVARAAASLSASPTRSATRPRSRWRRCGDWRTRRLATVPALLVGVGRPERIAAAPGRGIRLRSHRGDARHAPPRLAHARPRPRRTCPSPAGWASRSTRAIRCSQQLVRERVRSGGSAAAAGDAPPPVRITPKQPWPRA